MTEQEAVQSLVDYLEDRSCGSVSNPLAVIANPKWEEASYIHDWRHYVAEEVVDAWEHINTAGNWQSLRWQKIELAMSGGTDMATPGKPLDASTKAQIVRLRERSVSVSEIARQAMVSRPTVRKILDQKR